MQRKGTLGGRKKDKHLESMVLKSKKPILVTGSHRSGTTWVGRIIAASPSVVYINQPFSPRNDINLYSTKFDYWFTYISDKNEQDFYEHIKRIINFRYNLLGMLKTGGNRGKIVRVIKEYLRFFKYRFSDVRPLLKDPIALFSAEWLASRFDMDVVILIRHPAAFAGSLKVKNWTYQFAHFLEQPLLMKDHLYEFEADIRNFVEEEQDILDQAALLWKLIHHMITKYEEKHQD